ncbi:DDB1- and CUL4-associated factor 8-like [Watersipora subatra]|uniref:DDB1- and CUL4-associated factor 8-like n=1 Tax=Watersipora subatra TaxID=2589382 RepID=UPI00355BA383
MEDSVGPAEEEKGDEVVQENSDKSEQSTIAGVAQGVAEGDESALDSGDKKLTNTNDECSHSSSDNHGVEGSLMPMEPLCSDDSDTAGYYTMSPQVGSSQSDAGSRQPSYQRGLLSSSSDDSLDDEDDDDDDMRFMSAETDSSTEQSEDTSEELSVLNADIKAVPVRRNLLCDSQTRMLGDHGCCGAQRSYTRSMMANLNFVRRLKVTHSFRGHTGCVNALNFNPSGTWLASGSDDTKVYIWDVRTGRAYMHFYSGHDSNVFQTKFMPHSNDSQLVTTGRDGKVRLAELSSSGSCRSTKKLAQHSGAAHKLAVETDSPHCLLSAGEDSVVFQIDLRQRRPTKLLTTKHDGKRVALYSIDKRPQNQNEFAVSGRDQYVRIYDKRKIGSEGDEPHGPVRTFYPHGLTGGRLFKHVTAAVYSFDGSEIVASYNDDDIYLFDTSQSNDSDAIATYSGHRNSDTIKGVNFFGPCSEYIVSGSDCGHVYLWDKRSQQVVQIQRGDEGVVNVLEPHPFYPYLAVSGLAHDPKLLMPVSKDLTDLNKFKRLMTRNKKHRRMDSFLVSAALDRQIYLSAMGLQRRRRAAEDMSDSDSDDMDGPRNMRCSTS